MSLPSAPRSSHFNSCRCENNDFDFVAPTHREKVPLLLLLAWLLLLLPPHIPTRVPTHPIPIPTTTLPPAWRSVTSALSFTLG